MVFFRFRLVKKAWLFLPQKYDQLSVGVGGGGICSGIAGSLFPLLPRQG